jgi:autophagy-related protein 9
VHEKLGISKRKLQAGAVSWDTVVSKLLEAQESGEYLLALTPLDPLRISQRIMRKENFLIAFWNQNLLDTKIGDRYYWCSSLEWCTYTCVLNFMFNHKYEIRPAFCLDADSLERRLKVCGIVHALLLPFLIIFVLLHFLLQNVYDFKTTRQYMGDKYWSSLATWTFREFNELPHVLQQRLEPSCEAAENYTNLFGQSEWKAAVGRICVFLGGALGGVLLLLGVMNDAILLHVQLWRRNLLWYAGIAGIVYSIGKALVPTKEAQPRVTRNLFADMDAALKNVSKHTHYYPENWKGRGWDASVYASFGKLFDSKVKLFVWELSALLLAPYILFAKLSKCAPAICEFCLLNKARVPNAGDVTGYSTFDFDTFRDEAWEGRTLGKSILREEHTESLAESMMRNGNVEDATRQHPKPKSRHGKMEKCTSINGNSSKRSPIRPHLFYFSTAFFNFQATHPNWKCSPSGQSLITAVEDYRKAAISRERDWHIEAANRQLDTLARLEPKSLQRARPFESENEVFSNISQVPQSAERRGHFSSTPPPVPSSQPTEVKKSHEQSLDLPHTGASTVSASPPASGPTLNPSATPHQALAVPFRSPSSRSNGALPLGLSTEIRRLSNMPSLDVDAGESVLDGTSHQNQIEDDRRAERQVSSERMQAVL